ncbi:MAG: LD-carboxypeptidase [Alphaproteobacteria bacterium]|nr:LD-carboxypeptidase [Alphaproteobacteria bacterium]
MKHMYLIAPSGSFPHEMVDLTRLYFESLGRKITVPKDILGEDLLCANSDEMRFKYLKEALISEADEIMMIRGGYGLTRLMPMLLKLSKPEKKKIFYGISDGTALHIFLNQVWDWPSIHGPVGAQFVKQSVDRDSIERTVRIFDEGLSAYLLPPLIPLNSAGASKASILGKVVGGNLSLIQTSIGTPWQLKGENKIVFFEDVNERGYHIDRILSHLEQAQLFVGVRAVLFGDFVKGEESDGSSLVWDVIQRFAHSMSFPVYRLRGCGHGVQNYPLPFNYELDLTIQAKDGAERSFR